MLHRIASTRVPRVRARETFVYHVSGGPSRAARCSRKMQSPPGSCRRRRLWSRILPCTVGQFIGQLGQAAVRLRAGRRWRDQAPPSLNTGGRARQLRRVTAGAGAHPGTAKLAGAAAAEGAQTPLQGAADGGHRFAGSLNRIPPAGFVEGGEAIASR